MEVLGVGDGGEVQGQVGVTTPRAVIVLDTWSILVQTADIRVALVTAALAVTYRTDIPGVSEMLLLNVNRLFCEVGFFFKIFYYQVVLVVPIQGVSTDEPITWMISSWWQPFICSNHKSCLLYWIKLLITKDGDAGSWYIPTRSEERRVGKGCISRWSPYH